MRYSVIGRIGFCGRRRIGSAVRQFNEDVQWRRSCHFAPDFHCAGGIGRQCEFLAEEGFVVKPKTSVELLSKSFYREAANPPYKLPPPLFNARCRACWFSVALLLLVVASFVSLNLDWAAFASLEAGRSMYRFMAEFFPPDLSPKFVNKVVLAAWETLAMSALGTIMAAVLGLALAVPASRISQQDSAWLRSPTRWLLNALRAIPELVWAALLLISAGLGPMAGTLALALHTSGVLGRLFAEAMENIPTGPGDALRTQGVGPLRVFAYATLPQVLPQLMSYTLYRWENNIRAAAVLGVVGAGGLGQMLSFNMGLFLMNKTATILGAMLLMVACVDALSFGLRRWLNR
jgi:phosphonate transport system permease protein